MYQIFQPTTILLEWKGLNIMRPTILFFLFILLSSVICYSQTTYYIDTTGNDSNNGTSRATPWKTVQRVNTFFSQGRTLGAGDSILFKRGQIFTTSTAKLSANQSGLIDIPANRVMGSTLHPAVIGSYGSGLKPILTLRNCPTVIAVIYTRSFQNLVIRDLELRGGIKMFPTTTNGGISGLLVDSIYSNGTTAITEGYSHQCSNYAMVGDGTTPVGTEEYNYGHISNVEVRNSVFNSMNRTWDMYAMRSNLWFHHNRVYNSTKSACDLGQGKNVRIEYNWAVSTTLTAFKVQAQRWLLDTVIIRGNLIVFTPGAQYGLALDIPTGNHVSIYNNTIVTVSPYSFNYCLGIGWIYGDAASNSRMIYYTDGGRASVKNYFIANNVLYGGVHITEQDSLNMKFWNGARWYFSENLDSMKRHGVQFKNNIIYSDNQNPLIMKRIFDKKTIAWYPDALSNEGPLGCYIWSGGTDVTYPKFVTSANFNTAWNGKYGTNDRNVDPLLVDINGADSGAFRPQPSSPALNNGIAIPGYTHDISGCPVPQSGAITIGCFQSPPSTDPPPSVRRRLILKTPSGINP